ncbi:MULTISPECIES: MurR/RpiR family transcriptional regulator [unclassified Devosia]|uniref:MurR/RpiR family transcriptional regulator n=1 Tax=unclassified Devosia TaxID=196773 RepID=UPI00145EDA3C|nr:MULTISPECIES: MurR/RpiR family transcriptional regulator [unclassified Devosia]MBJ6987901.1 MurR/RpiR family transcriptional regulator [Devosia sp. MC521]QMW63803.1 MurR/RpiR family transcriptional regulator [Devosia sp. MC521]
MTAKSANVVQSDVIDIVSRMQRVEGELSPAEQQVLKAVRVDFEATTRMTIAELAKAADVSQPTVTRFCRSIGSASFADFKINLATTLTVAAAYLQPDRQFDDDAGQLAQSIMSRAINAMRDALNGLDTDAVTRAIAALSNARRVDIYGQGGGSASLVEDAKLRLFRIGLPVSAYIDGHQQRMSAATLSKGDVVIAISNSGRSKAVAEAVQIASSFGATTIALTRPDTPVAEGATILIPIVIAEDENVLAPTPSRYAHMMVIDTIAAGVASERGAQAREILRRVRYTVASIGIAIPAPSTDPTILMKTIKPHE